MVNLFDGFASTKKEWFFRVKQRDLMISGSAFGDEEDTCYLAVMNNNIVNEKHNVWYVGNILLQEYYIVFDASARDPNSTHKNLRIGFAK